MKNRPKLKEQIFELRKQGKTYKEIAEKLDCTKSIVSYWCGEGQIEKQRARNLKIEPWKRRLSKAVTAFKSRLKSNKSKRSDNWKSKLKTAVSDFCKKCNMENWGYKHLIERFGLQTKCYLTGRDIDLTTDDYNLDHIVPVSKGGDGSFDNVGITIPIANASKSGMTLEEYLSLCEEVLRYHKPELFKDL